MDRRAAEAIRDGEQVAAERNEAEMEMEETLIAQQQRAEGSDNVPVFEPVDESDSADADEQHLVTATDRGTAGDQMGGISIGDPAAEKDPSEIPPTSGQQDAAYDATEGAPTRYKDGERRFEGSGRQSLSEQ
ncbi:MAG: hypothetical protein ABI200_04050 [Gaiellales bacterium]